MQDKGSTKSTFDQQFLPLLSKKYQQLLKQRGIDKYVKKLSATQFIELIAHSQLKQQRGLRDISNSVNCNNLSRTIGLDSISASQLSRKLRELPTEVLQLGQEGINKMKHPLRLVETEDTRGNKVTIITNDFQLGTEEISNIYRYRWQIELFFKWLKQHLKVKHFYGTSEQAVKNQVFIAFITYCLLVLMQRQANYHGPLLFIKRLLCTCLYESFETFLKKLHRKARRSTKGRCKVNHEAIYQETVRQVMAGEAEYLDDLTYEPVINCIMVKCG